jgi:thiamine biosynthesis lipoprotein
MQIAGLPRARATPLLSAVEAEFSAVERDWYAFGDGELARVNGELAAGRPATLSPTLRPLISRAIELHRWTDGAFDPAVCALVRLWRFDREEQLAVANERPPPAEVQGLRARQGRLSDVTLEGATLTPRRPLCIDLGGLAKGSMAERIRARLTAEGVQNALLDIGGSTLLALGRPDPERRWLIGVKDPRGAAAESVIAVLELDSGETVTTSGDYERYFEADGRRYHHVLDPETGEPAAGVAAVVVVLPDAEAGEAASKALMVAGPARFGASCRQLGLRDALLVTADGRRMMTDSMASRLQRAGSKSTDP